MDENKTVRYVQSEAANEGQTVTIFDGSEPPYTVALAWYMKDEIYFGRDVRNDIVLRSPFVSRRHGRLVHTGGRWRIEDLGSVNGLICNHAAITSKYTADGDLIRIDGPEDTLTNGVLLVFGGAAAGNSWSAVTADRDEISIGRNPGCTIKLPHISVSNYHAKIIREHGRYYIIDNGSTNGVIVNNQRISGRVCLHERDVIVITNAKLIFTSETIYYCCCKSGISVDASDVVVKRGKGAKSFVTCDHVSLGIDPGELVAVIGGSGAGKSTILNCMCGYLKPSQGEVYINGVNLYGNFDSLKKLIGYVPQSDIVYDNLTLHDMLLYTAKLRLPKDITLSEREAAVTRAINMVELQEKRDSLIKSLSGGQRKRASIAVELLSDPKLLFLDEPASGLDPGTERNLMQTLRKMADGGKTIMLVTHSTLQLRMCDKIVFMGKGGRLCFYGSYEEALEFFGVSDLVDVYNMITDQAVQWRDKYQKLRGTPGQVRPMSGGTSRSGKDRLRQLGVLSARYLKLVTNDRQRLLLLLLQAPLLAALISFVADGEQFNQYEMTKSLLFALSCSAFWVGMLNAIQEICKERTILKREYMTGLSLTVYLSSKIMVLGMLCLIQSVLITGVFAVMVGLPGRGVMVPPFLELLATTFITALSSTAMGLFVSSLFTNADRAMTVAPILLMPQILFSGLIFKLNGAAEVISWFAVCRWSMEGYGTTANLNTLPLRLQQEGIMIPHNAEAFFDFTVVHLLASWGILALFVVVFLALARIVLSRIGKEPA